MKTTTIGIIGTGPAGLYATYLAGYHNLKVQLFDQQSQVGGKLVYNYPDQTLQSVVSYPAVKATKFIDELKSKLNNEALEYHVNEAITAISRLDNNQWRLKGTQSQYICDKVIIATGNCIYWPNDVTHTDYVNLAKYGIHYSVPSNQIFRDKTVLIVGGNSSALEWAITANALTRKVYLINMLQHFDCDPSKLHRIFTSSIETKPYYESKALLGDPHLKQAIITNKTTNTEETLMVNTAVIQIGSLGNLLPFHLWGFRIYGNAIRVDECMKTNLDGVYAIGDIAYYPGKVKLVSSSTAEASIAISNILKGE